MELIKEKINNIDVWFVIEPLIWHDEQRRLVIPTDQFMCYFRFEEPNQLFYGELLRDENNIPMKFRNSQEAKSYGINYLKQRYNL